MPKDAKSAGVRVAKAEFAAAAAKPEQLPPENKVEVAFAGRSNVGKSTLLNMLLQRRGLARTSSTPGCTRQIVFFDVALAKGPELAFVDLPGYGYAKVSKTEALSWKRLLEGYLMDRETLRAVVLLVDVRRGLEVEEKDLLEFIEQRKDVEAIVAATKLDKLSRSAQKPALAKLAKESGVTAIGTSGETGAGREELWSRILARV